jgi:anti-sigma factor RsiW
MNMDRTRQEPERGAWLMSLALDDMLEPSEAELFDTLLAEDPELGEEWALWQAVDAKLLKAPRLVPSTGFVAEFERRQAQRERQRRLWFGLIVGVMAATLWVGLLAGLAGAGAYVMFRQADTLVALVHGVAYWYSALQSQLDIIVSAASALLGTTQVRGALLVYVAVAALTLACWVRFLRRSVEMEPNGPAYVRSA